MICLTSFSKSGYDLYGKKFLETFVENWPCRLIVYYEDLPDFKHEKIEYRNLFDIQPLKSFLSLLQGKPMCMGNLQEGYNYNFDIWKFCRKSFAQFDALQNYDGRVIWLDADIETLRPVPEEWVNLLFEDAGLVFLGRKGFHTETGFVGFDTQAEGFKDFLRKYIDCYRRGIIFSLARWHDCEAFDWAREFNFVKANNLSPHWKKNVDSLDVFGSSVLSEYMIHFKGNRKLEKAFNEADRPISNPA